MFATKNGWTKEAMKARIRERNNGKRALAAGVPKYGSAACRYLAPDDNCCAVGAFIPEDEYSKSMEGNGAETLFEKFPGLIGRMPLSPDGMDEMQTVHDSCPEDVDVRDALCAWIDRHVRDEKPKHAIERNLA